MRVIVATEAHFLCKPDGTVCSDTGGRGYDFWKRYLEVFDSVTVLARVSPSDAPASAPVEGPGVSLAPLPGYRGPREFVQNVRRISARIRAAYAEDMACIARVPGALGGLLVDQARRSARPFALEVVGDPHDAFSPGAIQHPLRSFFRWHSTAKMRRDCARAGAVAYVTEKHLQRRYPAPGHAFTTYYSSVELPEPTFVAAPRQFDSTPQPATLVQVGTQSQMYKGQDVLLDALAQCAARGIYPKLLLVGDGRHRCELETKAKGLGLAEQVEFLGQLPSGEAVRRQLDRSDLFVMPSRTEGLPRSMIEAMARGLPCIGSDVGGIPELLPAEDLVTPGNPEALAIKISEVLGDRRRLSRMSARNLHKAQEYGDGQLRRRRTQFYAQVKKMTAASHTFS